MGNAIKFIGVVILAVAAFAAGWLGREYQLLGSRYRLTQPLSLAVEGKSAGTVPAGVVLYHYRALGEIDTYMVFVNTKRLDVLRREQPAAAFEIVPVEIH